MSYTVECPNCGKRKHRYKPCESCGFASGNESTDTSADWGEFALFDNTVDLIGLFLDPDIQAARDEIHAKIENGSLNIDGGINSAGQAQSQAVNLTQPAKTFAKAVVSIQAIQKQAERERQRR